MKKRFRYNIGMVTLTGETRHLGHGLEHEVIYSDGSKGWEFEDDLDFQDYENGEPVSL